MQVSELACSRRRGLFITGTDTNVGKTVITGALAAACRADGLNVGVWKPLQSGAALGSGRTDAECLIRYGGLEERADEIASYTFEAPLAPMLAAREQGQSLVLDDVCSAGSPYIQRFESLLVEGAGGVAVPITADASVTDLIQLLRLPVLIVARSGLGTVNHTLLTISYLQQRGIAIAGVILNDDASTSEWDDPSITTNARLIEQYGRVAVLGRFPYMAELGQPSSACTADAIRERLIDAVHSFITWEPLRDAMYPL